MNDSAASGGVSEKTQIPIAESGRESNPCGSILPWILMFCLVPALFSQGKGGRWRFENNGADTADWDSSGDEGGLTAGAVFQESPAPAEGTAALVLDPAQVNACFLVPDGDDLDFTDENIAISAWVWPSVLNDVHFILSKGDQYGNSKTTNYAMRISTGRNLEFLIRDSGNQARTASSRFTIPMNEWTFVAVYYDYPAGKVTLWNGTGAAPADTVDFRHSFFANDDPLCIGAWFTSDPAVPTAKGFKGSVDDVRISGRPEDVFPAPSGADFREAAGRPECALSVQAFPNPIARSETAGGIGICFNRATRGKMTVQLFNVLGREIHRTDVPPAAGSGQILHMGLSRTGAPLNTGVYFLRIVDGSDTAVQKLLIVQ
jgi:hypothetical protein